MHSRRLVEIPASEDAAALIPTNFSHQPQSETSAPAQITRGGQDSPVHRPFLELHPFLVAPEALGVLVLQGQVVHWGSVPLGLQDPGVQLGLVSPEHLAPPFVPSDLPRDKEDIGCHNLLTSSPHAAATFSGPESQASREYGGAGWGRSIVERRAAGQGRECGPEVNSQ